MNLAQACSQFDVGTDEWRECIQDSATGGGLMPWIVVVPLGVMVIGMAVMFTWQFTRKPGRSTNSGAAPMGVWLIFTSLVEGSIGVGMAVGESRADGSWGGYGIGAAILLVTAGALLVLGVILTRKGTNQVRPPSS